MKDFPWDKVTKKISDFESWIDGCQSPTTLQSSFYYKIWTRKEKMQAIMDLAMYFGTPVPRHYLPLIYNGEWYHRRDLLEFLEEEYQRKAGNFNISAVKEHPRDTSPDGISPCSSNFKAIN